MGEATWKWRAELRQSALGVTAGRVAEAAGMSGATYSALLRSDNAMTATIARVEQALGVPAGWLVKEADRGVLALEAATFPAPAWIAEAEGATGTG